MNVEAESRAGQGRGGTPLVLAAQAGDRQAREALAAAWLPLVYNVAGRALNGHADVDDVAQETMIRALDGLDGLRDPDSFRSWLVAITMNQVRRRSTVRQQAAVGGLDETWEVADPAADFTDLTILRLGLSGQRREVAEATRWLDPDDRELLALWWLEASGELTRTELAEALDLTPQHTAVRVQRMKKQLEAGRMVVRALTAYPRCPELAELTGGWDGAPNSVWRKRITRHIRGCPACDRLGRDLFPAEGLLAGLALVPLPLGWMPIPFDPQSVGAATAATTTTTATTATTGATGTAPATSEPVLRSLTHGLARGRVAVAGGALLAVATLAMVWPSAQAPDRTEAAPEPPVPTSAPDTPLPVAVPVPSSPAAPTPTAPPEPAPTATPSATPTPTPTSTPTRPAVQSLERQVVDLVNAERARTGCGPLRVDPHLHTAAQRHAEDMAARNYLAHTSPEGTDTDDRLGAVGYRWSQWGENLDRGPATATVVFSRWMDGGIHQSNMLNCSFKDLGVGTATGPGGLYWVQVLGTPMS